MFGIASTYKVGTNLLHSSKNTHPFFCLIRQRQICAALPKNTGKQVKLASFSRRYYESSTRGAEKGSAGAQQLHGSKEKKRKVLFWMPVGGVIGLAVCTLLYSTVD